MVCHCHAHPPGTDRETKISIEGSACSSIFNGEIYFSSLFNVCKRLDNNVFWTKDSRWIFVTHTSGRVQSRWTQRSGKTVYCQVGRFFVFFLPLCGKIMTWKRMIWRKVPWNSVGLFRWAMCMTFLTAAPCIRIQIWCPCVFGWGGVALYFTCEMERPFGKQALSGLPFAHAHALCSSTLSSVWQRYSYCSSSE